MFLIADNAGEGLNYISLQVLRVATSNFSINNKLGEGGFGEVFKVCIVLWYEYYMRIQIYTKCTRDNIW